jgi:hypothetical protein
LNAKLWSALLCASLVAGPAHARDTLGVFDGWGAFRDAQPNRCFAIAEPAAGKAGQWRPYASIGFWPQQKVRGQLHIRLSRERKVDAKIYLTVDDRRWELTGGKYDVWAPSPLHDSYILAKMRSSRSMSIASVATNGGAFADTYKLSGAATAVDAAALGCAKAG